MAMITLVQKYLEHQLYPDATFLCERLFTERQDESNLFYLATCYHKQGAIISAYRLLKEHFKHASPRIRYLLAVCATFLGKDQEAEKVLLGKLYRVRVTPEYSSKELTQIPFSASGMQLLGSIYVRQKRYAEAIQFFQHSLTQDPFLFTSYQALCELGEIVEPRRIFYSVDTVPEAVNTTKVTDHILHEEPVSEEEHCLSLRKCVLNVYALLATAYQQLLDYNCSACLSSLSNLSLKQYNTGWVLHKVACAYFELGEYAVAKKTFSNLQRLEPFGTRGLDIYSTTLWHLKDTVSLCNLAQEAIAKNRLSERTWCVVGNCFSLQKEHENAICFFQRAIHINCRYTYAYTLVGHEYVSNEDFNKAVECYRQAVTINCRHYNAWYGLGTIYFRQEKYSVAEFHFNRAISINSKSSILYCYLGMVLAQLHAPDYSRAMQMLRKAAAINSSNPQAPFQRGVILTKLGQFEDALLSLLEVRDFAPREASVYFHLGKICASLGRTDDAWHHFDTAHDLDPKNGNLYKSHVERLLLSHPVNGL